MRAAAGWSVCVSFYYGPVLEPVVNFTRLALISDLLQDQAFTQRPAMGGAAVWSVCVLFYYGPVLTLVV